MGVLVAVAIGIIFVGLHAPTIVLVPVNVFDEGLQLASGTFASKGLILFRDFYVPYGPANSYLLATLHWLGIDSIQMSRALFVLLNATVAGLGSYLIFRRSGLWAALFFGVLAISFPPAASYTGVVLLLILAYITTIGWRAETDIRPFADQAPHDHTRRLIVVGLLLAMTVWFRWEFLAVLPVWWILLARRPPVSRRSTALIVWLTAAVAVLPYMAIAAVGGGPHMIEAIKYAVVGYPKYRGLPFPFDAPKALVVGIWSGQPLDLDLLVYSVSFFAVGLGLILLVLGPPSDRWGRIGGARFFARDETTTVILVGSVAAFLFLSLRTRPDAAHAAQLVLIGWIAVLWSKPLHRRLAVVAAIIVVASALVVAKSDDIGTWPAATEAWTDRETDGNLTGRIPILNSDYADLEAIARAWGEYRLPDQTSTPELFVANRTNRYTFANAPLVYWLLDASPAHWITTFDPGFADSPDVQADMVQTLCGSDALVVLRSSLGEVADRELPLGSEILDEFIESRYVIILKTEHYDLMAPKLAPCIPTDLMGH